MAKEGGGAKIDEKKYKYKHENKGKKEIKQISKISKTLQDRKNWEKQ